MNVSELTNIQTDNLVKLGKVWGFLKYYHPSITAGNRQWDYELFRILPAILGARDHATANAVLAHWIETLGAIDRCHPFAIMDKANLQFPPDLGWIANTRELGADLSQKLVSIRDNRMPRDQFYVSKAPEAHNSKFDHELGYPHIKLPDFGFQLLAVYRFWNIVEYWSPYRNVLGEDWTKVLAEFIPRIAEAKNAESYKRELFALIASAHDGHASLWNALDARPPVGKCEIPINVRFLRNFPTITGFAPGDPGDVGGLKVGDVITELDDVAVARLVERWKPYYSASNEAARFRDIGRYMTRGRCGESELGVRRGSQYLKFSIKRMPPRIAVPSTHDRPGPAFRLLSKDVAYLKLSSVKSEDCPHYVREAAGTKGLIIDIRNYPSEFVVFSLGSLLVNWETAFARPAEMDLYNPGASRWDKPIMLTPQEPHYSGKVVILVDELTQSSAEYTAMALRSANRAVVIGSTTAGADGNVSPFALPGGLQTMISGAGVYYPNKKPTQRIGIVPDIEVRPSIAGIRAGRDEVLDEAMRQIVGRRVPREEIETAPRSQQ